MPGPYDLGQTITLEVDLADPDTHLPVDAGDLVCHVKPPTSAMAPVTPVTTPGAGKYRARYLTAETGEHWYQFSSVTLGGVLKEGAFVVLPSRVS